MATSYARRTRSRRSGRLRHADRSTGSSRASRPKSGSTTSVRLTLARVPHDQGDERRVDGGKRSPAGDAHGAVRGSRPGSRSPGRFSSARCAPNAIRPCQWGQHERKRNKPLFASRGRRDVVARGRRGEPIALGEAVSALARRLRNLTKLHAGATRPSRARCACLTRPPRRSRHLDGAHDLPNTEVLERASASARRSARQCPVGTERRSSAP